MTEPQEPPLVRGEIVFDDHPPSFGIATIHVFVEDTTLADAPARVLLHHVVENVSPDMLHGGRATFALRGRLPEARATYTVRVLVDVDGDGKASRGDYVSTVSYPLAAPGRSTLSIRVRPIR
jgi:hypothetical protein